MSAIHRYGTDTDMYMDATIQQLAGEMVSEYGGSLTDQLVDQMKRYYGIE